MMDRFSKGMLKIMFFAVALASLTIIGTVWVLASDLFDPPLWFTAGLFVAVYVSCFFSLTNSTVDLIKYTKANPSTA